MNTQAASKEKYFALAGEREQDLRALDRVIREAAPNLKPVLAGTTTGKMLGYGMQPYKTKSGKETREWPLVAVAAQKNYISLYVCAVADGKYIAETLAEELGKVNVGRSCIRFKRFDDLNEPTVRKMLADIDSRVQAGEQLFGM